MASMQCVAQNNNVIDTNMTTSHQTASGLSYKIIRVGKGARPKINDEVKVLFTSYKSDGELLDGTLNGMPVILPIAAMFSGLQEGLMLMQEGSIYELYIPKHLGYKEEGKLKNNAATYKIELIKINP
ncbi:FKBP-type peptidyl-prolyl cis-trans isomerase [Seminibacterium arietis]|uniref:Peptidyl-prolyl cis-trans isomerase n=1 Tax=Seminibacterium arietis TaxID=1173502 RepID=A0ABW3I9K6_9PAST